MNFKGRNSLAAAGVFQVFCAKPKQQGSAVGPAFALIVARALAIPKKEGLPTKGRASCQRQRPESRRQCEQDLSFGHSDSPGARDSQGKSHRKKLRNPQKTLSQHKGFVATAGFSNQGPRQACLMELVAKVELVGITRLVC